MADTAADIALIEATLSKLYAKSVDQLSARDKSMHFASIEKLQAALSKLEARLAAEGNSDTGGLRISKATLKGMN